MARPPETRLNELAKKFDDAYRDYLDGPPQPEGTLTVMQYAKKANLTKYQARDRLRKMLRSGNVMREPHKRAYVYRLVDEV